MQNVSRRKFIKLGIQATSLLIAVSHSPTLLANPTIPERRKLTACLEIDNSGNIILRTPTPEMGQGMMTTGAQIIAEELRISLENVAVEYMEFEADFDNSGRANYYSEMHHATGGSMATMMIWDELRKTAAYARSLLLEAASQHWQTAKANLKTKDGLIFNALTGKELTFSSLVEKANSPMVSEALLLSPADLTEKTDYKVIGFAHRNVHSQDIVTGKPLFSIDVKIPGMLHAVIKRCPYLKGEVESYDDNLAKSLQGVRAIIPLKRMPENIEHSKLVAAGVAVIADSFWIAKKASQLLEVKWKIDESRADDTNVMKTRALKAVETEAMEVALEQGDVENTFKQAKSTHSATYFHPHWAHTCMEPHNCIAHVKAGQTEIWVGHQNHSVALNAVTRAVGIPAQQVKANYYRMGTGLGRKSEEDYIIEACLLSKAVSAPIKVTWLREDEMEQDFLNSSAAYKISTALDDKGDISAWHTRIASDGWSGRELNEFPIGIVDVFRAESYRIPNNIRRGAWRGPGQNTYAWVNQSFINELAYKSDRDHLEYLLSLYSRKKFVKSRNWPFLDVDFSRHISVLTKAADMAGYHNPLKKNWGRGIAVHFTYVSVCAHVVEVEMLDDGDYRVHRVSSAVDCGLAVNPLGIKAQIESAVIDGLCAARYGEFIFENGKAITNNFHNYNKMRIKEAPKQIDVHIMDFGDDRPRGVGEVGMPPIIPALTNAIFSASGKRIRTLPIKRNL